MWISLAHVYEYSTAPNHSFEDLSNLVLCEVKDKHTSNSCKIRVRSFND